MYFKMATWVQESTQDERSSMLFLLAFLSSANHRTPARGCSQACQMSGPLYCHMAAQGSWKSFPHWVFKPQRPSSMCTWIKFFDGSILWHAFKVYVTSTFLILIIRRTSVLPAVFGNAIVYFLDRRHKTTFIPTVHLEAELLALAATVEPWVRWWKRWASSVTTQGARLSPLTDCPACWRVFRVGNNSLSHPPPGQERKSTVFHGSPTRSSLLPQFNLQIPATMTPCGPWFFYLVRRVPVSVLPLPTPLTWGAQCSYKIFIAKGLGE